jgi:hypothetical protein
VGIRPCGSIADNPHGLIPKYLIPKIMTGKHFFYRKWESCSEFPQLQENIKPKAENMLDEMLL